MRKLPLLAPALCLLLIGCGVFGSDDDCGGREGLFIQTDRESYQVGEEATLTIENCIGETVLFDGRSSPDYELEKRIDETWEVVGGQGGLFSSFEEIGKKGAIEVMLPAEPQVDRVDTVIGTYRFELDIHDSNEDPLPKERRRSNTFEVTE